jgi:hypothetical protein
MKEYYRQTYPELYVQILKYEEFFKNCGTLFHVTNQQSAESIISQGFRTEHCGKIHGSMEIRPKENTTYFSMHSKSNNLNSNLFNDKDTIVVIAVDSNVFDINKIYPDDGFFAAYAQEEYLENETEFSQEFGISIEESTLFFSELSEKTNAEFAEFVKPLWPIYLSKQGEISTTQNIPLSAIRRVESYDNDFSFDSKSFDVQLRRNSLANAWAYKLGTKVIDVLGEGNHGTAYLTESDKVLKITDDPSEVINSNKLLGKENKNLIKTYAVEIFKDNLYGILQERLSTGVAKNNFEMLMEFADNDYCFGIETLLDDNEVDEKEIPEKLIQLYKDIKSHYKELIDNSLCSTDLTEDNIGQRDNGDYVVFDISNEEITNQEVKLGILEIRKDKAIMNKGESTPSWG